MNKAPGILLLVVSLLASSGCVVGRRSIDLQIESAQTAVPASKGTVAIRSITDNRIFENKPASPSTPSIDGDVTQVSKDFLKTMIGRQRNGYGKAMGDIQLIEGKTVEVQMRQVLEEGFRRRGYTVTDASAADNTADVTIDKFWAWFTPGFWAVDFESQLNCEMTVASPNGTEKLTITGYGKNVGQVASDANWQLAYSRAFSDFLANLDVALARIGL